MLTLADMSQLSTLTPFQQAVVYSILSKSQLFDKLSFSDVGDLNTMVIEAAALPTPSHRALNPTSINVATAAFNQRIETLKIMSDKIPVDRQLLNNKSSHVNPKTAALEQYTRSVAYEVVNQFLNGNPITNPDQPKGLIYRFQTDLRLSDGSPAPASNKQVIDANAQNRDLTAAAQQQDFLNDIHEMLSLLDEMPDVLITNRQGRLAIGKAARGLRQLDTTTDMFGRPVESWQGIPIIDAGYTPSGALDRSVQVLATSTTSDDWADAIFAVKFGDTMAGGLQKHPPETKDFEENSADFPNQIATFEWPYGFHLTNPFAVAVIRRAF